jgi:hypothetical protein
MSKKIVKFPISHKQRLINKKGDGYVPCEVSDRWLQFNDVSHMVGNRELIELSVMTNGKNGPYRICNLIVEKEDLERVLDMVEPINN